MIIERVEVILIETPRYYGHVSSHVLVKVHVDDGPVGLGEASDSHCGDVPALAATYNDLLIIGSITARKILLCRYDS